MPGGPQTRVLAAPGARQPVGARARRGGRVEVDTGVDGARVDDAVGATGVKARAVERAGRDLLLGLRRRVEDPAARRRRSRRPRPAGSCESPDHASSCMNVGLCGEHRRRARPARGVQQQGPARRRALLDRGGLRTVGAHQRAVGGAERRPRASADPGDDDVRRLARAEAGDVGQQRRRVRGAASSRRS